MKRWLFICAVLALMTVSPAVLKTQPAMQTAPGCSLQSASTAQLLLQVPPTHEKTPQSLSVVHDPGQVAAHWPAMQVSVAWQELVSVCVHATHVPLATSQTWCIGSHAAQSALEAQLI